MSIANSSNPLFLEIERTFYDPLAKIGQPVLFAIFCVIGVILLTVGQRILRVTLFLVAFLAVGLLVFFFLSEVVTDVQEAFEQGPSNFLPPEMAPVAAPVPTLTPHLRNSTSEVESPTIAWYWRLLAGVVSGVAAGCLTLWLLKVGLFALGCFFGFVIASVALAIIIPPNHSLLHVFDSMWQVWLFVGGVMLICGCLTLLKKCRNLLLAVITSAIGAFLIIYVIDHFAKSGFSKAVEALIVKTAMRQFKQMSFNGTSWACLIGWLSLTAIGTAIQLKLTAKKGKSKHQACDCDDKTKEMYSMPR